MSDETRSEGFFDKFAATVGAQVARPWFFATCVLMVLVWAPSLPLFGTIDTWQLVINTGTTIVTFVLVALLQNTQDRSTKALNHKLDAALNALATLLEKQDDAGNEACVAELRNIVGVTMEPSKKPRK